VELDWEDEEGLDKIRSILPFVVAYAENDALDDEQISLREWVRAAKGDRRGSDLQWLLEVLGSSPLPPEGIRTLYKGAELLVGWELRDATNSRTLADFPRRADLLPQGDAVKGTGELSAGDPEASFHPQTCLLGDRQGPDSSFPGGAVGAES